MEGFDPAKALFDLAGKAIDAKAASYASKNLGADPASVQRVTKAFEVESDGLGDWVAASIERDPDAEFTTEDAYDHYQEYCERGGIAAKDRVAEGAFARRLKKRFADHACDVGPADARQKGYRGLRLRSRRAARAAAAVEGS